MLLPFLMVPLAIPRSPKGGPQFYEWEYKRRDRPRFRAAMIQRDQMIRSMRLAMATQKRPPALAAGDSGTPDDSAAVPDGRSSVGLFDTGDGRAPPTT